MPFKHASALVVGIDCFGEPGVRRALNLERLECAAADAQLIQKALEGVGYPNVKTLLNERAEYWGIIRRLDEIRGVATKPGNSLVVIYLAGHACEISDPLTGSTEIHVLPYDTKVKEKDGVRRVECTISLTGLAESLNNLPAKHKVLFLDTCHSALTPEGIEKIAGQYSQIAWLSACRADQEAGETGRHGFFAPILAEALCGAGTSNTAGMVSVNRVGEYVREEVPRFARHFDHRSDPTLFLNQRFRIDEGPFFVGRRIPIDAENFAPTLDPLVRRRLLAAWERG